ncbi:MAG: SUMF1/EgtB/PvdO family nonheme iron enzyme [Candidatus Delongbacteria bacterium]|jgi:formylglycine-generating enzyme required for sulfatase activity|nr:SUMF1/EgtB/PvdO family nonheme iron enzyme [Candidatus Delongbacteria bacterium]
MKKWIVLFLTVMFSGSVFISCSEDDSSTEPSNNLPSCTITSPADSATFTIGNNITVNVVADDSDGNIFEIRFYIDNVQKGSDQSSPYSYILNTDTLNTGIHKIKTISEDNDGAEKENQININLIQGNAPPVINGITADPTSVQQGGTSTFTCNATDADVGDVLSYSWSANEGTINGTSSSETWTAPLTVGDYTITCVVSDGEDSVSDSKTITVEMLLIQGGTFQMGDHFNEGSIDELPLHSVTVSDFYMSACEVTQSEWSAYMPAVDWSSYGTGDNYPAYYVSWYEIIKYCNLRSIAEGLTPCYEISGSTDPTDWGAIPTSTNSAWNAATCNWSANGYRLPTEAEWEYAARGVLSGQRFPNGATISHSTNGDTQANYYGSTSYSYDVSPTTGYHPDSNGGGTLPVGSFPANGYGLYDMSGNLYEWCWDWYGSYTSDAQSDPTGSPSGTNRVLRGGGWGHFASYCRVASRGTYGHPYYSGSAYGFRVVRTN